MNDEDVLWDRSQNGSFPEIKELKRIVRNKVAPKKDLGHTDGHTSSDTKEVSDDDDEYFDTRMFFGVA